MTPPEYERTNSRTPQPEEAAAEPEEPRRRSRTPTPQPKPDRTRRRRSKSPHKQKEENPKSPPKKQKTGHSPSPGSKAKAKEGRRRRDDGDTPAAAAAAAPQGQEQQVGGHDSELEKMDRRIAELEEAKEEAIFQSRLDEFLAGVGKNGKLVKETQKKRETREIHHQKIIDKLTKKIKETKAQKRMHLERKGLTPEALDTKIALAKQTMARKLTQCDSEIEATIEKAIVGGVLKMSPTEQHMLDLRYERIKSHWKR
eukprot:3938468-Rhodomonas_salina.1